MREFWDESARRNAAWYVDTSLDYDAPDMEAFFAAGRQIVADTVDVLTPQPADRDLAVEIGSGLGRICLALADRYRHVVGIDISPEMVRRARELVDHPAIRFEVGEGATLTPIADESADLVFSFTVFQHIPDPEIVEAYIAEAGRVLKPGGVLAFQWDNRTDDRTWPLRRAVLALLQRTGLRPERYRRHDPAFLGCRIPVARIRAAVERAGLVLADVKGEGTLWTFATAVRAGR